MKIKLKWSSQLAFIGFALIVSNAAHAVATLQLDIEGGYYNGDVGENQIMANEFSLFAYANPTGDGYSGTEAELLADTYFVSMSVFYADDSSGVSEPGVDLGSFDFTDANGVTHTVDVTNDMSYGIPPLDTADSIESGNLRLNWRHEQFMPTYFYETSFQFDPANTSAVYDVREDAGSGPIAGTGMYYQEFMFDLSNLALGVGLHFDLFNTIVKYYDETDTTGIELADYGKHASAIVPEPASILLMGAGLVGVGISARRRKRSA